MEEEKPLALVHALTKPHASNGSVTSDVTSWKMAQKVAKNRDVVKSDAAGMKDFCEGLFFSKKYPSKIKGLCHFLSRSS